MNVIIGKLYIGVILLFMLIYILIFLFCFIMNEKKSLLFIGIVVLFKVDKGK